MSDPLVLSISIASGVVLMIVGTMVYLHFDQKRDLKERALELKMFQMENSRIIQQLAKSTEQMEKTAQQRHEENMTFFQGIMQSIARVIRKQEEGDAPK